MKQSVFTALLAIVFAAAAAHAQGHTDIQFSYVDDKIDIAPPSESSPLVFASEFPISGIEQQFTTLPGIASETDVGLGIGPGDEVVYNVLEDLFYWDGVGFVPPDEGFEIHIRNNPPSVPDTVVNPASGFQPGIVNPPQNRVGAAGNGGDFHVDLQWFLEPNDFPSPAPDTAFGAYGVKLSLSTSAPGIDDSDPLLFVFNFGLDAQAFDDALAAYASLLLPIKPGDFDQDGDVDVDDFLLWHEGYGIDKGATLVDGDANGDEDVDGDDFLVWQANFDVAPAAAAVSVPEPGSGVLFVLASCVGMLIRLRCRGEDNVH